MGVNACMQMYTPYTVFCLEETTYTFAHAPYIRTLVHEGESKGLDTLADLHTLVTVAVLVSLSTHPQMQAELVRPPVRGQEQEHHHNNSVLPYYLFFIVSQINNTKLLTSFTKALKFKIIPVPILTL